VKFAHALSVVAGSALLSGCSPHVPPTYTSPVPTAQFQIDGHADWRIAYHDSDPVAAKTTLVMIHGLGGSSVAWSGMLDDLSDCRVIRVDLLGHGQSTAPQDFDYSMASQATCIAHLLDSLQLESYVVVGASYGGGVAAELAHADMVNKARRLDGMVLVGAAALDFPPPPTIHLALNPVVRWWLENISSGKTVARIFLDSSFHRRERIPQWLLEGMADGLRPKLARRAVARGGIEMFAELQARAGEQDRYRRIDCPALLVWGEHDRTVPRSVMSRLRDLLPNARTAIIDDCGHTPHEECPHALAAEVNEFLSTMRR
jgi:pimeloyl-ACP methyl ester carboxylesterase